MQLEDYFDFLAPDDIRIKGSRVGIESVLYEYIYRAQTPEEIERKFSTITLEQVYATILYYLYNKESISEYISKWLEYAHQARKEQELHPSAAILKLRQLKTQKEALSRHEEARLNDELPA